MTSSASPSISFFGSQPLSPTRSISISSFLAHDTPISIIPSFSHSRPLGLISGTVGPFHPGIDTIVPLWLAVMLKRRKLAKIILPHWMDVEVLKEVLRFERDPREANFSSLLPYRHAEIAQSVLTACQTSSGDSEIPNADRIKLLLEDIATVRMDKIRKNIHTLSSQILSRESKVQPIIDVTNIGSLEMHSIQSFVVEAFRLHRELEGRGSMYNEPPSLQGTGSGGERGARSGSSEDVGRRDGRLRVSRLARDDDGSNDEELMVPRPLEDIEAEEEENNQENEGDDEAGRSRIRRHR